jgi:two-component system, NtrC family, response regulator AtoC
MPNRSSVTPGLESSKPTVFVMESNHRALNYIGRTLGKRYRLSLFSEPQALVQSLRTEKKPDLFLLAWDDAKTSQPFFLHLRTAWPEVPVVVLTFSPEIAEYEIFATLGATAVVLKPFTDDSLQITLAKCLPVVEVDIAEPKEILLDNGHSFVRSSKRMRQIEAQANLVARSDIPVLILGESGTGKEILALFTHKMSLRCNRMFLKINCAAMPAELLESELFGHEQGAFTGATKMKPGKFEICDGGTIFLDEIGEMPAALQAKLLHVLQDGSFSRLGSRTSIRTDVRVIAATNIDMKKAMAEKLFREDLYYRLNGISLVLPPLRERIEEIPAFASYFIRKAAKKYGVDPLPISTALLDALTRYPWPGNLREMENIINRFLILQDERAIISDLVGGSSAPPSRLVNGSSALPNKLIEEAVTTLPKEENTGGLKRLVRGIKGETEAAAIAIALAEEGWNRKAAANALQISYKALLYKIKQYELAPKMNADREQSRNEPQGVSRA